VGQAPFLPSSSAVNRAVSPMPLRTPGASTTLQCPSPSADPPSLELLCSLCHRPRRLIDRIISAVRNLALQAQVSQFKSQTLPVAVRMHHLLVFVVEQSSML